MRPEALAALEGVNLLLHAGDVCRLEILSVLREIAPLRAVRGNCDHGAWASELPRRDTFEVGRHLVHMVHDLNDLDLVPEAAEISLVISGHTHRPLVEERRGVIYLNPGSAGPRRFRLPITLAIVDFARDRPAAEIIPLLP